MGDQPKPSVCPSLSTPPSAAPTAETFRPSGFSMGASDFSAFPSASPAPSSYAPSTTSAPKPTLGLDIS